jgi:hypothetical protein
LPTPVRLSATLFPSYWIMREPGGGWFWVYYDSGRREVARSSRRFGSCDECIRSLSSLKQSGSAAVYYTPAPDRFVDQDRTYLPSLAFRGNDEG